MILAIVFIVTLFLIVPIKFRLKSMLSIAERKLYYSITAYKIFKINCGYFDFKNANVKLSYSKYKVKFLTFNDLLPNSESVNFLKHFSCHKLSSAILLGEDVEDYKFYLCTIINSINPVIYNILSIVNPYLKYKNDTILLASNSTSGLVAEIDFYTNAISLIAILFKKLFVKILGGNNGKG